MPVSWLERFYIRSRRGESILGHWLTSILPKVYGQNVQLFHWPQAWADIDGTPGEGEYGYCLKLWGQRESLTLGPTIPGKPNTAVSGTMTFTSPTVRHTQELKAHRSQVAATQKPRTTPSPPSSI